MSKEQEQGPLTLWRNGYPTACLDTEETSAFLAISRSVLRRLTKDGRIPHTRVGTSLRYRLVDLKAFLEENTATDRQPDKGTQNGTAKEKQNEYANVHYRTHNNERV